MVGSEVAWQVAETKLASRLSALEADLSRREAVWRAMRFRDRSRSAGAGRQDVNQDTHEAFFRCPLEGAPPHAPWFADEGVP
jgi:hypothetical protein